MTKLGEGEFAVMTKTQGSVVKNIRAVRDFPSPKLCYSITSEQEQWVKCNDFIVLTGNRKGKTQTFVIVMAALQHPSSGNSVQVPFSAGDQVGI